MTPSIRIAQIEFRDLALLSTVEAALIEYFQPLLNGTKYERAKPQMTAYMPDDVNAPLDKAATKEQRSRSQMVAVLVREALIARGYLPAEETD